MNRNYNHQITVIMRKVIVFLLLFLFSYGTVIGRSKEKTVYESIYNNSCLQVVSAVSTDTATVLVFEVQGKVNAPFVISSNAALIDEHGMRHPILRTDGARLDEKNYISHRGVSTFTAYFDILPGKTSFFDFIDSNGVADVEILGIHQKGKEKEIPRVKELTTGFHLSKSETSYLRIRGCTGFKIDTIRVLYNTCLSSQFESIPVDTSSGECLIPIHIETPVWGELFVERTRIPFYIEPREKLCARLEMGAGGAFHLEEHAHEDKRPCATLFTHLPPLIHATWNDLTCNQARMESDYFVERAFELEASNMALCDYYAWKYGFTPLEVTLLKNRQRILLAEELMLLASRLFQSKVEVPRWSEPTKADFIDYDYTMYKVAGVLPFDNPLLGIDCYFNRVLGSIRLIWPMFYWSQYAYYDSGQQTCAQTVIKETTLQIDELRRLVGFRGMPWLVQAYYAKVHSAIYQRVEEAAEREAIDEYLSSILTDPHILDIFRNTRPGR